MFAFFSILLAAAIPNMAPVQNYVVVKEYPHDPDALPRVSCIGDRQALAEVFEIKVERKPYTIKYALWTFAHHLSPFASSDLLPGIEPNTL